MINQYTRVLALAGILMLAGCATGLPQGGERASRPEDVGFSSERLQKLTTRLTEGAARGEYPGEIGRAHV